MKIHAVEKTAVALNTSNQPTGKSAINPSNRNFDA